MINNRQNGRRRGRGGGGNGNGNGNPRSGNPGRPDGGNRIDNRARGNANQLYEKYKNLARDAQMGGDRVTTEYYLQFADHYFRVLSESRSRFDDGQSAQQLRRQSSDGFDDFDGDEDYGDEGEPIRAGEQDARRTEQRRDTPRQDDSRRDDTRRDDTRRDDSRRDESRRDDGRRDETPRDGNRRPAYASQPVTAEQGADDMPATPQVANDRDDTDSADAAPRRTRRPRRERTDMGEARAADMTASAPADDAAPVAADSASPAPAGFDADRLPPSLSLSANSADDAGAEAPKPRRRRVRTAAVVEADAG